MTMNMNINFSPVYQVVDLDIGWVTEPNAQCLRDYPRIPLLIWSPSGSVTQYGERDMDGQMISHPVISISYQLLKVEYSWPSLYN